MGPNNLGGETKAVLFDNRDQQGYTLYAGSAYVAADTIIGPFYLGVGTTEFDYYSVYISLGQSF